jgi:hypothetical protein
LEKVEPFTEAVKRQLEILKSTPRTKVFPRAVQFCPWGARDRAKRVLDGVEVA